MQEESPISGRSTKAFGGGELLNLRWGDVDLESGRLVVRNRDGFTVKNGRERTVPLRGDALKTLRAMKEDRSSRSRQSENAKIGTLDNDPVFVDANDDVPKSDRVSKRFKFYVRKAGLSDREELSFHSCRHTTGSWQSMQDVPLRVISEIPGPLNMQLTEMDRHLSADGMDCEMEELSGNA